MTEPQKTVMIWHAAQEYEVPVYAVEPEEGESLGHFCSRFRRANNWTITELGRATKLGAIVSRWEKFYLNPWPTEDEVEALAKVVAIPVQRLWLMLPPPEEAFLVDRTRLCGRCFRDRPFHQVNWQIKASERCPTHGVVLLAACPRCHTRLPKPASWKPPHCLKCFLPYAEMHDHHRAPGPKPAPARTPR